MDKYDLNRNTEYNFGNNPFYKYDEALSMAYSSKESGLPELIKPE